jgi:hypothetical protein
VLDVIDGAPDVLDEVADVIGEAPEVIAEVLDFIGEVRDVIDEATDGINEVPNLIDEDPDVTDEIPEAKNRVSVITVGQVGCCSAARSTWLARAPGPRDGEVVVMLALGHLKGGRDNVREGERGFGVEFLTCSG